MRISTALTFILLFSSAAFAQNKPQPSATRPTANAQASFSPQLMQELATIRDAALADDYTYRQVAHLTENIGPRMSGSAQAQKAVEYVDEVLKKMSVGVRLEVARMRYWWRGIVTG